MDRAALFFWLLLGEFREVAFGGLEEFSDIDPLPASPQAPEQRAREPNSGSQTTPEVNDGEISTAEEVWDNVLPFLC